MGTPTLHNKEDKQSDARTQYNIWPVRPKPFVDNKAIHERSIVLMTILSNAVHFCKRQLKLLSTQRQRIYANQKPLPHKINNSLERKRIENRNRKRDGVVIRGRAGVAPWFLLADGWTV